VAGSSNPRKRGGGNFGGVWGGRMGIFRRLEEVGEALVTLQRSCHNESFTFLRWEKFRIGGEPGVGSGATGPGCARFSNCLGS